MKAKYASFLLVFPAILTFSGLGVSVDMVTKDGSPSEYAVVPDAKTLQTRLQQDQTLAAQGKLTETAMLADSAYAHNAVLTGTETPLLNLGTVSQADVPAARNTGSNLTSSPDTESIQFHRPPRRPSEVQGVFISTAPDGTTRQIPIQILGQDLNYDNQELGVIEALLADYPGSNLAGIKNVVLTVDPTTTYEHAVVTNGTLSLIWQPGYSPTGQINLISQAIGDYAYKNLLSASDQSLFTNEFDFLSKYYNWRFQGDPLVFDRVVGAAGDPPSGSIPTYIQQNLILAALFYNPQQKTTTTSGCESGYGCSPAPLPVSYTADTFSVGEGPLQVIFHLNGSGAIDSASFTFGGVVYPTTFYPPISVPSAFSHLVEGKN